MTAGALKLSADGRRGLRELGRAASRLRSSARSGVIRAKGVEGVVDAADEVLVVVVTQHGALIRRSKIRGRALDARELGLQLAGAEAAIDEVARSAPPAVPPQLTSTEASLLDDAGFVEAPVDLPSALERSRIELDLLVRSSLSIDDAARALGVSTSRIRQRLSPRHRTLYGIKDGRGWRLPRFQFESGGTLVRGIAAVFPCIRRDAHPLAVRDWFVTPHQDLVVGDDDERVTPRAWLSSGRPPETVAGLAEEI